MMMMKMIYGINKKYKYLYISFLLISFLLIGCSQKTINITTGDDITLFSSGFGIKTSIVQKIISIEVDNPNGTTYSLWVRYKYSCSDRNGVSNRKLYESNDIWKNVIIDVPEENISCDQIIFLKIMDIAGNVIYKSHGINLIGEIKK